MVRSGFPIVVVGWVATLLFVAVLVLVVDRVVGVFHSITPYRPRRRR